MEIFPNAIVLTTGALALLGLLINGVTLFLTVRFKSDDKFCSCLFCMALVSNVVFLFAMAATSSHCEIEGHQSVYFNYGLCRLFGERVCNVSGALAYQGTVFFPSMLLVTFLFRSLMAVGYRFKPYMAIVVFSAVYLFSLPKFITHLVAYNKVPDVAGQLSQKLNTDAKQTVAYAVDIESMSVLQELFELLYSFLVPFVLLASCFASTYGYYRVCTDWESFNPRIRDIFNGFVTASLFDCGLIALPYFLFDWDLVRRTFSLLTSQTIASYKLPFLSLPWIFQGVFSMVAVPYLRKGAVELYQKWKDFFESCDTYPADSSNYES